MKQRRPKKGLGHYPNALTSDKLKSRVSLDCIEVEWGEENPVEVYFKSFSAARMILLQGQLEELQAKDDDTEEEKRDKSRKAITLFIDLTVEIVVDPETGKQLMSYDEWMTVDADVVIDIVKKITGISLGLPGQIDDEEEEPKQIGAGAVGSSVVDAVAGDDPN